MMINLPSPAVDVKWSTEVRALPAADPPGRLPPPHNTHTLYSLLHPPYAHEGIDCTPGAPPPLVTLCGKMEALDRLLLRLHARGHKVGQD